VKALSFRPVVSCGQVHLPTGTGLQPFPLHRGASFQGLAFHPEKPWLAICKINIGGTESSPVETAHAVALNAAALRRMAAQMIEAADMLDIKPAKASAK
jgi:hypothetical protein